MVDVRFQWNYLVNEINCFSCSTLNTQEGISVKLTSKKILFRSFIVTVIGKYLAERLKVILRDDVPVQWHNVHTTWYLSPQKRAIVQEQPVKWLVGNGYVFIKHFFMQINDVVCSGVCCCGVPTYLIMVTNRQDQVNMGKKRAMTEIGEVGIGWFSVQYLQVGRYSRQ